MKKTLFILIKCFSVGKISAAFFFSSMISELKIPNDTSWEIGLTYGTIFPDSVKLISGIDTIILHPFTQHRIARNDLNSDTIIVKNKNKFGFNPMQGKLVAYFYSSYNNTSRIETDSVIYGNLPYALCPSLGGSRTFHHQVIQDYLIHTWLSEDNKDDIIGFIWTGTAYNVDGEKLKNKTLDFGPPVFYGSFTTNEYGVFNCHIPTRSTISHFFISNQYYPISPLSLSGQIGSTITADIHFSQYVDVQDYSLGNPLNIVVENNIANIKYETNETASIAIYSTNGLCVASKEIFQTSETQLWEITDMPKGLFICKMIKSSGETVTKQFIMR